MSAAGLLSDNKEQRVDQLQYNGSSDEQSSDETGSENDMHANPLRDSLGGMHQQYIMWEKNHLQRQKPQSSSLDNPEGGGPSSSKPLHVVPHAASSSGGTVSKTEGERCQPESNGHTTRHVM